MPDTNPPTYGISYTHVDYRPVAAAVAAEVSSVLEGGCVRLPGRGAVHTTHGFRTTPPPNPGDDVYQLLQQRLEERSQFYEETRKPKRLIAKTQQQADARLLPGAEEHRHGKPRSSLTLLPPLRSVPELACIWSGGPSYVCSGRRPLRRRPEPPHGTTAIGTLQRTELAESQARRS